MSGSVLAYVGAVSVAIWGGAHLVPTRSVVAGFGDISQDNRHIIAMEWITEGVALLGLGMLVAVVTWIDAQSPVSVAVYQIAAAMLFSLALVSLFTGFKVSFLPFKLCPFIFGGSAILIFASAYVP